MSANLKDTLNLPVTDFPMKGNLPEKEPVMIAGWLKNDLHAKILKKNAGRPKYTMPDGPPYANGDIHIGHVLNKCLKDFTVKYRNMAGFSAAFIPGWDCHGLPIEHKVTKDLGPRRKEKTDADIRELCRQEAQKWIGRQREQFQRLGVIADWEHPYMTLQPEYEAAEVRELARCLEKGIMYRGEKPVYWCPALQTALADTEVEYAEHKSPAIYVKFPFSPGAAEKFGKFAKPVSAVIWTTTPWTLPANLGISFHPEFDYGFYEAGGDVLVIAKQLKEAFEKDTGLALKETGTFAKGQKFERLSARHPFIDRESLFVLGEHVTADAGTGLVHTAPGHGQDDYMVGLKYGLKVYSPVDEAGRFTDDVPDYKGVKIWDANAQIVERLKQSGHLLHHRELTHQYPHNWRSKTPLIFRATPQWFLAMDDEKYNVRKLSLEAINKLKFVPAWGEARLRAMIENRPDWCLSRQRIWGVPIPAFYCKKDGVALIKPEIIRKVADAMEMQGGIEAYHNTPEATFTAGHKCEKCGGTDFRRGLDILDVWFDSGVCHSAVQETRPELEDPADIYLEGSDQHRGWFQTSLLTSIAAKGRAPYKALVTHGFVTDPKGRKMSKSLGNVVDPADITKKSGAEILRLWVAYEDFGQDVGCGQESFARVTETYRRFRNTMRFLLGNIGDFDPKKDSVPFEKMTVLDRWALGRLNDLIRRSAAGYDGYEFYKVYHALNNFFTVELSAGYLDMLKDRLYTWRKDSVERRSSQTVLYMLLHHLVRIMAPVTSFLSEETLTYLPGEKPESVFLMDFPKPDAKWDDENLAKEMEVLFETRASVSKSLETLRQNKEIGSGLDAQVVLTAEGPSHQVLKKYESLLPEFFIVSQVALKVGSFQVETKKADGEKCERCWYYSTELGQDKSFPTVCPKCTKALK